MDNKDVSDILDEIDRLKKALKITMDLISEIGVCCNDVWKGTSYYKSYSREIDKLLYEEKLPNDLEDSENILK